MIRLIRKLCWFLAVLILCLAGLHLLTRASNSNPDLWVHPDQGEPVLVVNHGYHSGLVLSSASLRKAAVELDQQDRAAAARLRWLAALHPTADWIEVGWGDAAFYQQTPTVADVDVMLGLKAILWPTDAVLQVVPGWGLLDQAFPASDRLLLTVSGDGFINLSKRLADTVPEPVPTIPFGPSLYGYGAFYPAELDYHLFRTCNHWVAWLLRGAGVPASPVPGTFSAGLMAELRWRLDWGI